MESNQTLAQTIETFNNSFVRQGQIVQDTNRHVNSLISFIQQRYKKEIDKRKTAPGKAAQQAKLDAILKFFSNKNKQS